MVNNAKQFGRPRSFSLSNVFLEKAGLSNIGTPPFLFAISSPESLPLSFPLGFLVIWGAFHSTKDLVVTLEEGTNIVSFGLSPDQGD